MVLRLVERMKSVDDNDDRTTKIKKIVHRDFVEYIDDIDDMIVECQGREEDLLKALEFKAVARREKEAAKKSWYHTRIRNTINESFPSFPSFPTMIDNVENILEDYLGKEKELFKINNNNSSGRNSNSNSNSNNKLVKITTSTTTIKLEVIIEKI